MGRDGLEGDGRVVAPLQVGQGVEGQGDRPARGPGRGGDLLDGRVGIPMSRAELAALGGEDQRRDRAPVGDAQGGSAEDAAQAPGLAACERDHGSKLL